MKTIKLSEYNTSMGILIDVRNKYDYNKNKTPNSINIPKDELVFNHEKYLNKNSKYFLICESGYKSRAACNILSIYGYNVVNVIK